MKLYEFAYRGWRHIINRIVYGYKASSKSYIRHLRKQGYRVGEGTVFFNSMTIKIPEGSQYMIEIGENCQITGG